ncbi:hypothetical protein Aph01nite_70710 [Acrocarpospora phusangensis]|uniref:Carrier domain-containing protein n=1 Tax=Acrocarpospora phusangensis TaxID=1070424 RepID=A0A919QJ34_9ACTN|nr:non-ribosomal peptide synthetase [Acrocarpospora phusangensis]GIH28761.1 hypothetical protein Aph01nite_70710 [Acrocarpospora phusangensis]
MSLESETPVTALVAGWARRTPDAPAVCDSRRRLTYGRLNAEAAGVARWLRAHGCAPEAPVMLLTRRSTEMAVGLLGVFKAGGAAVLANPGDPVGRLQRLMELVRPAAVLTLAELGVPLDTGGTPLLHLDTDPTLSQPGEELDGLDGVVHPDQLAYIVYTSGSTGDPKGVAVLHRALAHRAHTHRECRRITPRDRAAWLSPPGVSASAVELWPYLTAGASVHAAPDEVPAEEGTLRDWLTGTRITAAFVSMPMAERLFFAGWAPGASLRLMTVGSDRVRRWPPADLPFEVAVEYGSAEANGITSCLTPYERRLTNRTATDADRSTAPPVGRPWPGVRLHLLDPEMRPVPEGEIGEIYVGGPELARGYLGAPAATAARFVPDPFWPGGSRLYRTGDLGRRRPDGHLEHCGRTDFDVKIRGVRVDVAEVEAELLRHPGVREAVVTAAEHPSGERVLAAYLVADTAVDVAAVLDSVARRLPAQAVPAAIQQLERMPLTVQGKTDRNRLPRPNWDALRADYEEPTDEVERGIAQIWGETLGMPRVGRHDHFFRMGGTSLTATQATTRMSGRLGLKVRLRDLFRHPTLAQLADHLRTKAGN